MHRRGTWNTKLGFYLAAIGCAFGLGNLWRFPYVVGDNGGGAFVLIYLLLAFVIGMPLLIGELVLGKYTRQGILGGFAKITRSQDMELASRGILASEKMKQLAKWFGRYAVMLSLVVLSYYAVISGWVLYYLLQFVLSLFSMTPVNPEVSLTALMTNGFLQMLLAGIHILLTVVVVARGVQEGLEKWLRFVTPLFGLLLIVLVVQSMSLSSSGAALRFLFYPNFSMLSFATLSHAVGHVFFTLSVGFGTVVTFGSYLRKDDNIPMAGFRVTVVDISISLLAGLLIFPIAIAASQHGSDPTLLFKALPVFLTKMDGGIIFGIAFFLCLYLAALGASIGLLESVVANWVDRRGTDRIRASWSIAGIALVLALGPALSTSVLQGFAVSNVNVLVAFDAAVINWALPIGALGVSVVIGFYLPKKEILQYFVDSNKIPAMKLFSDWHFAIRWLAPSVIFVALVLQLVGFFCGY